MFGRDGVELRLAADPSSGSSSIGGGDGSGGGSSGDGGGTRQLFFLENRGGLVRLDQVC